MIRFLRQTSSLLIFLVLVPLYFATGSSDLSGDVHGAHYASWKVASTGEFIIDDDEFMVGHPLRDFWMAEVDGGHVIVRNPGVIAASIPAYYLADLDEFAEWPGHLTAALLVAGGVSLMHAGLKRTAGLVPATVGACTLALATPVWSIAADGVWTHSVSAFAIGGIVWASSTQRWWAVGFFGGVGLWGRPHLALLPAIVGLGAAVSRRNPWIAVKVAIPSLILLALTALWNGWMLDVWSITGLYGRLPTPSENETRYPSMWLNQAGQLFALERGVLGWSPVLVLCLPALFRRWRHIPDWSRWLVIAGVAYTLLQGYAAIYHGGDTFWGYRRALELILCLTPALVLSSSALGPWARRLIGPAVALQLLMIGIGAVLDLPGKHQESPWWHHTLAHFTVEAPLVMVPVILVTLLLGHLAARLCSALHRSSAQRDQAGEGTVLPQR